MSKPTHLSKILKVIREKGSATQEEIMNVTGLSNRVVYDRMGFLAAIGAVTYKKEQGQVGTYTIRDNVR